MGLYKTYRYLISEYNVMHPKWNIHKVLSYNIAFNVPALYGEPLKNTLFIPNPFYGGWFCRHSKQ